MLFNINLYSTENSIILWFKENPHTYEVLFPSLIKYMVFQFESSIHSCSDFSPLSL